MLYILTTGLLTILLKSSLLLSLPIPTLGCKKVKVWILAIAPLT